MRSNNFDLKHSTSMCQEVEAGQTIKKIRPHYKQRTRPLIIQSVTFEDRESRYIDMFEMPKNRFPALP